LTAIKISPAGQCNGRILSIDSVSAGDLAAAHNTLLAMSFRLEASGAHFWEIIFTRPLATLLVPNRLDSWGSFRVMPRWPRPY